MTWHASSQRLQPFLVFLGTLAAVTCLLPALPCRAGGGPENVFLVVNPNSQDSMTVANHYVDLRKIPPSNVFYLNYPPRRGATRGKVFLERILNPIFQEIIERKLANQIDYVVYSCDFPWRINFAPSFPNQQFPKQSTPVASLSSATYLAAFVREHRKEMFSLGANFYCTPMNTQLITSQGFRAQYRWSPGGRRAGKDGLPYMLSAVLGVNSVPGNTVREIAGYLKRAAEADGTAPPGTIYYARNKTIRSTVRDKDFRTAVGMVQMAGVRAQIVDGFFPNFKQNVAGVTCGHSVVDPVGSKVRLLPGAFCDNLTSAGGQFLPDKGQTCLSEFMRIGAAGACGTVVEPLALPQKFPNATMQVHYVRGCSLAEAFYQSVAGPFQQILVGDPLCQPWAKIPEISVPDVKPNSVLSSTVELKPISDTKQGIARYLLYVDGKQNQQCRPGGSFHLDTTLLADGYHELRVVAIDDTPIETQGHWIEEVLVKNGTDAAELSIDRASLAKGSRQLLLKLASTNGADAIAYCNGVKVGEIPADTGQLSVPKDTIGAGPITLFAVTKGKPGLRTRSLRVELPR